MNTNILTPFSLPDTATAHLSIEFWSKANRLLIKKAISEFAHELLIVPQFKNQISDWRYYSIQADTHQITYQFCAKILALNHWDIDSESIQKFDTENELPLDIVLFIKEFKNSLNISEDILPAYLEEIIGTTNGLAYKYSKNHPTARELVQADFQTIEQSMIEGHPGFLANNGRIGFTTCDYQAYGPESGSSFQLVWLAGHKEKTIYAGITSLPYEKLIQQELDMNTLKLFEKKIHNTGHDPSSYYFIPVHPWQWFNKLANLFAPDIASGKLICLGYGPSKYLAQQSIRTLFNITNPHKLYTKSSLSIVNMGFLRGLSASYLSIAPEISEWLNNLIMDDPYIKETGFTMLGEIASISYVNSYFEEFGKRHPFNKMLSSLWRESPIDKISSNQKLMTMAALLHIDQNEEALVVELIKNSGLQADEWIYCYLKAYLSPLLHCFYHYDLVFMPHGENVILVLENYIPIKIFLKDITEEATILSAELDLPKKLKRIYAHVPEEVKLLSIFIDIFDGFFRFMSPILAKHAHYSEQKFWQKVAECVNSYQGRYPTQGKKFKTYNMFAPEFSHSCLNRLQLTNNQGMIDLDDPVALLKFQGTLKNPITSFQKAYEKHL